jgi:L-amino acid N-acyltransferase YncA
MILEYKKILKDKTEIKIRKATINDLIAINDIYNYYVSNSTCTYQTIFESIENRHVWFNEHNNYYPIIVAEINKGVIGWASISKFKNREAYKPTVEISIYIRHDKLFNGIGTILLEELIILSKINGYHSIIAVISSDQEASVKLHEKFGFIKVAYLKEVGYKFDKLLDVVYFQLLL